MLSQEEAMDYAPSPAPSNYPHVHAAYYSPGYATPDPVESQFLDVYESKLDQAKDARDAIQKKTFTKWVNKHLKRAGRKLDDLFTDLSDGHNLLCLLEVLSGEQLPRERGHSRFQKLSNVERALEFLRSRRIKLVNIRPEEIVDGNPKLILGLIWTIILHFQVDHHFTDDGVSAKDALLAWAQRTTAGYPGVAVRNFTNSWRDGLAFNAVIHRYRPSAVSWRGLGPKSPKARLESAFAAAEKEFGVTRLLDPEDVDTDQPDEKSLILYVSSLYDALPAQPEALKYEEAMEEYVVEAREWLEWVEKATQLMRDRRWPNTISELHSLRAELEMFRSHDLPPKLKQKGRIMELWLELQNLFGDTGQLKIPSEYSSDNLERAWTRLLEAMEDRDLALQEHLKRLGDADGMSSNLDIQIGIMNEKLDVVEKRIHTAEGHIKTGIPAEVKLELDGIINDLHALTPPIGGLFDKVEGLKAAHHARHSDYYRQVYGLKQRQDAYLTRCETTLMLELNARSERMTRIEIEKYEMHRSNVFQACKDAIHWTQSRITELSAMEFVEELEVLEELFERHKEEHREVMDFRQTVDTCISRQAEVSAEDSAAYCELLSTLESDYQQLRDLSTGRMLDLDSLIAFVRAAQAELLWISEREELEVTRQWADVDQLDLPMLQNYYKQLLHEIELQEEAFNAVHNQGAALLNQGHPAVRVIEAYLQTMKSQWEWLLNLARCYETHLQDALNLKLFMEEAKQCETWMDKQTQLLETHYNRSEVSLDEGERLLGELDEIRTLLDRYHEVLLSLIERSRSISPLWQRAERVSRPTPVAALCDYTEGNMRIRRGDECMLLDNGDLVRWTVRSAEGVEGVVPSVVFRVPPPDSRLLGYLQRLQAHFERLRKLWIEKQRFIRFHMLLNTMRTIRSWDLEAFLAIDPEQREAILKALNDDTHRLMGELDPNDPLYIRLKEELRLTNEHFYNLLQQSQIPPGPDIGDVFDERIAALLSKLEEAWKQLNRRVGEPIPRTPEELEQLLIDHKNFEDSLQGLDTDMSSVKELYQQLPDPSPMQRSRMEQLSARWEDLWELSRMFVERLKAVELVLSELGEASDIVKAHEVTLASFERMPADLDSLRAAHSQLLELNMVLQQQQPIMDDLGTVVGQLRQHVARTRFNQPDHPDVDRLEDQVQRLTVRWENVCAQLLDRLKSTEMGIQVLMVYRSDYENEISWLDRVEATINSLRNPASLRPEEYQEQLDLLMAEYTQLNEHTNAIENVNHEGGKYIREAKTYDLRLSQFEDSMQEVHSGALRSLIRKRTPTPKAGSDVVTKELEDLNRRFSQLSSIILERRNVIQVLIQNWRRQQQEDDDRARADEEARRRAEEEARRRAAEEAERLRRLREEEEARRRNDDAEAERLRKLREEEEARRRAEEARRRADEDAKRRAEEEARRRAAEAEARRRAEEEARRRAEEEARRRAEEERLRQKEPPKINMSMQQAEAMTGEEVGQFEELMDVSDVAKVTEHEDEMQMYQEETVTKTQFYEMEGVKHMKTGEILTFVEAVRQGLLDLNAGQGEYYDIVSDSKISLEKAAELGHISTSFNECLNTNYGIRDPETKEELTLLDAIQRGIYDPDSRQLQDPKTGEVLELYESVSRGIISMTDIHRLVKIGVLKLPPMPLQRAIEQRVLNVETGTFTGRYTKETMPLKDALRHGYVTIVTTHQPTIAISLTDCLEKRFVNAATGEFKDKHSGDSFTLREAVSRNANLINLHVREIVNTAEHTRIPVSEAVIRNALNTRQGNFTDLQQRQSLTLQEAYDRDLIQKPMSLKEVSAKDLVDSTGRFIDGGTRKRPTLIEAIAEGLIDPECRHIIDPEELDVISLAEALERGIITPDGKFHNEESRDELTLMEAAAKGLLVERVHHSIFDVKAVKNTKSGENLSFNEAVEEGIVNLNSERFINLASEESCLLPDSAEKGLVDPMLHQILSSTIGIKDKHGSEINVFRAVCQGIIDTQKNIYLDKRYNQELSPKDAYEGGLISLRGAMQLSALFDVHPSLVSQTRPAKIGTKRVRRPGSQPGIADDQIRITLAEAMKQGLIDTRTQRFREGDEEMSLQEALNKGLVDTKSEWIMPAKAENPTIQESVTEKVTETSQVLAPKIFPDRNTEETVTTVKRQRTTETTSVGGPGGVSAYRAITGGKGSIEVPMEGMHVLEAERAGILDLKSGLVTPSQTNRTFTLEEAFELGLLSSKQLTIADKRSGKKLTAAEAMEKGVMTPTGQVKNTKTNAEMSFKEAIDAGLVHVDPESLVPAKATSKKVIQFGAGPFAGPVMQYTPVGDSTFEDSESSWKFDASTGEVIDGFSGARLSLDDAIKKDQVSKDMIVVKDTLTGREMSYTEAVKWGIIDATHGYFTDKRDGRRYPLRDAASQGHIYLTGGVRGTAGDAVETTMRQRTFKNVTTKQALMAGPAAFVDYSLNKILELGWYDSGKGVFTHPDTKKQMTLKEAIIKGLFNPYESIVTDPASGKQVSFLDAVQQEIIDPNTGMMMSGGRKIDLESACRQGLIKSGVVAQSLSAAIESGRLDIAEGLVRSPDGQSISLHEAVSGGQIDGSSVLVKDPESGREMSLTEAAQSGVVDLQRGLLKNKRGGTATSLASALRSGDVRPAKTPGSSGSKIFASSSAIVPRVPAEARVMETMSKRLPGQREEMVDLGGGQNVMVKVVRGDDGVEKGEYLDPKTGMKFTVQLHGDPYVTQSKTTVKSNAQVQSVELEPHAELVGIDMVRDLRTGRTMTLKDAQRIGLAKVDKKGKQLTKTYEAFRSDITHALKAGVKDPTSKQEMSLEDAIHCKLINIQDMTFSHPVTGEVHDFAQAANMGLMDVTLAEVLPRGVCNPANGENVSIKQAIQMGIIDPRTGHVRNPFTNEKLTWHDILRSVYASLTSEGVYDPTKGYAVAVTSALIDKLIDPKARKYCNPITGVKLDLADAEKQGLIDEETLKIITKPCINDWRSRKNVDLLEAVSSGLIDPHNRSIQIGQDNVMPIDRAVQDGKLPSDVGDRLRRVNKLNFADALGKGLIDVAGNSFIDPDSGVKMTIAQALEKGYIDTGSVEAMEGAQDKNLSMVMESEEFDENSGRIRDQRSGLYLTFAQAITQGLIDGDSLLYDVDSGKTMTLQEAVSRGQIDSNGKYIDHSSGAKVGLRDAIRSGLLAVIESPGMANQAVAEAVKRRDKEGSRFKMGKVQMEGGGGRHGGVSTTTTVKSFSSHLSPHKREPTLSLKVKTDESQPMDMDPQAIADRQYDFLEKLRAASFDTEKKTLQNPVSGRHVSTQEAVETGLLDVMSGEIVNPTSGRRYSIPRAVHMKMLDKESAKTMMETLNLGLEELHSAHGLSPRSDASPRPGTSPGGGGYSYSKEVSWKGKPSELRAGHSTTTHYSSRSSSSRGGNAETEQVFDAECGEAGQSLSAASDAFIARTGPDAEERPHSADSSDSEGPQSHFREEETTA